MKRKNLERNLAVALFIAVLITFSFAERDSKKLDKLYSRALTQSSATLLAQLFSGH